MGLATYAAILTTKLYAEVRAQQMSTHTIIPATAGNPMADLEKAIQAAHPSLTEDLSADLERAGYDPEEMV